jgi:hypothetical protein
MSENRSRGARQDKYRSAILRCVYITIIEMPDFTKTATRHEIRRVVVVLASSRTGSSFLFHALNLNGRFLSPTGEETPFYRSAGLGMFSETNDSDVISIPPSAPILDQIGTALLQDVGEWTADCVDFDSFVELFFQRLNFQWPGCLA